MDNNKNGCLPAEAMPRHNPLASNKRSREFRERIIPSALLSIRNEKLMAANKSEGASVKAIPAITHDIGSVMADPVNHAAFTQ